MSKEKGLSDEKLKAKEYVDFYYFWLYQYGLRKQQKYQREMRISILKQVLALAKRTKFKPSAEHEKLFGNIDHEYSLFEQDACLQKLNFDLLPTTLSHRCDRWCENSKCAAREEIISLGEKYDEIEYNIPDWGLYGQLLVIDEVDTHADSILLALLDGEYSIFHCSGDRALVQRDSKKFGIDVIGSQDISLTQKGTLTGTLLISIDLSAPKSFLFHEIEQLKEMTFKAKPSYQELAMSVGYEDTNYPLEYALISAIDGVAFSPKDSKARALGLWLYDTIDVERRYTSVAEALSSFREGTWYKESAWSNRSQDFIEEEVDPGWLYSFPLAALGYANSEISVFRRLYRNTKKCIEACEVLSLK